MGESAIDRGRSMSRVTTARSAVIAFALVLVGLLLAAAPQRAEAQELAPELIALDPAVASTEGGTIIALEGRNLDQAAVLFVGETEVEFTADSATLLTFTAPANVAGTVPVTVTDGSGTPSNALELTYRPPPTPTPVITSLTPRIVTPGLGQSVTIAGFNLANATVMVGSSSPEVTSNTDTTVVFVAPSTTEEALIVTVSTPGGGTSNPLVLDYRQPTATESPAPGPAGGTGSTSSGGGATDASEPGLPATGVDAAAALAVAATLGVFGAAFLGARRLSRR
jgi:hypothetical protein